MGYFCEIFFVLYISLSKGEICLKQLRKYIYFRSVFCDIFDILFSFMSTYCIYYEFVVASHNLFTLVCQF